MNSFRSCSSFGVGVLAVYSLSVSACATASPRVQTVTAVADDSVNIGYGQTARRDATGPVASLDGESARRYSPTTVADMIDGRFAGVEVQKHPDGSFSVRVRGQRSFLAGEEPLFVLDGVPLTVTNGLLRDLNPKDIERIEVLKGSAASVYGSRGANGVILISLRPAGH